MYDESITAGNFDRNSLTLTCAEGRFRPCLPILQNPQQFSDERQNYTLPFTHTHRTLC